LCSQTTVTGACEDVCMDADYRQVACLRPRECRLVGVHGGSDNPFPLPHRGAPGTPWALSETRGGECLPCGPTNS